MTKARHLGFLAAVVLAGCSGGSEPAQVGGTAPTFRFSTVNRDSSVISSESLRGKPVVLNFWSTSCSVCLSEIEDLNKLQKEHGVRVVGIALDEDVERVRKLATEREIQYDVVMGTPELFQQFDGYAIPHTVVLSKDQTVQRMIVGRVNIDDIQKMVGKEPVTGVASVTR